MCCLLISDERERALVKVQRLGSRKAQPRTKCFTLLLHSDRVTFGGRRIF
jgi:hypothetical protein